MTKLLRWCNLSLIFVTLLSYVSPFVSPEKFWMFSFFGLLYPWLLLANFLFIVYWGIRKERYLLFSIFCILIGWNYFIGFIGLNNRLEGNHETVIKIASYNTGRTLYLWNKSDKEQHKKSKDSFFRLRKDFRDIDIHCAQEASKYAIDWLTDSLAFPLYFYHYEKISTTFIFSKTPFLKTGFIDLKNRANSCIWADLNLHGKIVRIYNVHLQSSQISDKTDKLAKDGNLQEKETWKTIGEVLKKYVRAAKTRAWQAEKIAKHIAECPHPVILCGDLNDTPLSYPYNVLSENLHDTFKEKGKGIGTTYAGSIPALRIDFIFADQNFEILNHEIIDNDLSDHYPVVGTLRIKEK